jgi:hypothetical protein
LWDLTRGYPKALTRSGRARRGSTTVGLWAVAPVKDVARRADVEFVMRSHTEVEALFDGLDLVEPGVVWVPQWRPESTDDLYYDRPEMSAIYAGVGRKP